MTEQHPPYQLGSGRRSRSISFENPTGAAGAGGRAASPLGIGRKGAPARTLRAGEEVQLADISAQGVIHHIWMTTTPTPEVLRGLVIRAYWDGQSEASVAAPVGDFFGSAHGKIQAYQSAVHSVGERGGLNIWLDMPFRTNARLTVTNELDKSVPLFYQIDYTLDDILAENLGHLHVLFRRENPTQLGNDFELLPRRVGAGRLIGVVMGVRPLQQQWWGEGEVKMYLDGDEEYPTIIGTGAEDYVGLSWGLQQNAFLYNGASWLEHADGIATGRVSMYRWHLRDPIIWQQEARVTVQQIGHQPQAQRPKDIAQYQAQLFERADDWCATTFWYQTAGQSLPVLPNLAERLVDIQPK